MRVYEPLAVESAELCHPTAAQDGFLKLQEAANGVRKQATWRPLGVRLIRREGKQRYTQSDAPWTGYSIVMILRSHAVDRLRFVLGECELLPLVCADAELCLVNPPVVSCLDVGGSKLVRFTDGTLMRIETHVFIRERLLGCTVFKIPDLAASPTFVTDDFVSAWRAAGLVGLEFRQMWSSDECAKCRA